MEKKLWNYDLRTETGGWLGQVVLTSDGMFASVTDYGNLSFAWRAFGDPGDDFRNFILRTNEDYFAGKMYQGLSYIASGRSQKQSCDFFAAKILPALKDAVRKQMEEEKNDPNALVGVAALNITAEPNNQA